MEQQPIQPIAQNVWWVIPGKLAGVAVHCTSGRRRTGTMLASYLISAGSSYDDAMQAIQSANPEVELREAQTTFLRELAGVSCPDEFVESNSQSDFYGNF